MGWVEGIESRLKDILGQKLFSELQAEHTQSLWSCHGAMQALVYRHVFDILDSISHDSYRTVSYESLCRDPEEAFRDLFEFAGFPYDEHARKRVRQHSRKEEDRKEEPYSTHRRSTDMINAWKRDLSKAKQSEIREAYLSMHPPVYENGTW
ncbi:sulfotransferase domain-containing protein [Salinibacter ruber]|uniref:sulfotransferase domain-containing protein n=1 Tax=Salinibacter ruber TaxID=146919 RepID=UPI003C6E2143